MAILLADLYCCCYCCCCCCFLKPKSILVLDDASFHHLERIAQVRICVELKSVYLLPYSPDVNLIEEGSYMLRALLNVARVTTRKGSSKNSDTFLPNYIDVISTLEGIPRGKTRPADPNIDEDQGYYGRHSRSLDYYHDIYANTTHTYQRSPEYP